MCGRYAASRDSATLVQEFRVARPPQKQLPPDYNVAPTKEVYLVADRVPRVAGRAPDEGGPGRELAVARWGLIPHWAKDRKIGYRMINARVETVASKPAFRQAFAKRRCLLPADGYYEWYSPAVSAPGAKLGKSGKPLKQPYFIHPADGSVLAMAGLYEYWCDPGKDPQDQNSWLRTTTIITTQASDDLARIHDRMPACVEREFWTDWLNPDRADPTELLPLLSTAGSGWLEADPVSTEVNNVRNNCSNLTNPLPIS